MCVCACVLLAFTVAVKLVVVLDGGSKAGATERERESFP